MAAPPFEILLRLRQGVLPLWFGVDRPVNRSAYAKSGFFLAAVKYAVEFLMITGTTGRLFTPLDFVNPILSFRVGNVNALPDWLPWALAIWALPFLWIAVTMSVRRAADAGWTPWAGFYVLVPMINLLFMAAFCFLPSYHGLRWGGQERSSKISAGTGRAVLALGAGSMVGICMFAISVFGVRDYGSSLFLATPLLMGATTGYIYNSQHSRPWGKTLSLGAFSVACGEGALFLFALEGIICLLMAFPLVGLLGMLGGVLGKAIADATRRPSVELLAALIAFPLTAVGEAQLPQDSWREVATSLEIAAPIEGVWESVVGFDEITAPPSWYFRWGIACPIRARIVGTGSQATRYCEFTTGTFVEPITVWERPHRLAFDVASQPVPMTELSPFPGVHPPHLDDFLRTQRGEFVLRAVAPNRTLLTGRTWYEFSMYPQWYWSAWSDLIIHRIHLRVLHHVRQVAEDSPQL